ncbi:MAG: sugar ABC transporter ATP-binding protein [Lachnospiraceae bacterium]|nr:sugar ABC transporter ATP-binding protein [Lachnospiraceae bacterium]
MGEHVSKDQYLVEMHGITKSFAGIRALDHVDFLLEKGKVNCLCGENGAGKSTLIKILSGAYQYDEGEILLEGKSVKIPDPKAARLMGISPIYQELDLIDCLSISENIFLGNEACKSKGILDKRTMNQRATELMEEVGVTIDVQRKLSTLSVALKQMVAIAKALSMQSKVLILDEPSDVLTGKELDTLFEIIRKIKSRGVGIIYISHRLEEVFEIGDSVTIFRDGKMIMERPVSEMTRESLIRGMVGHEVDENILPQHGDDGKQVVLEAEHICSGKVLKDVSFKLRAGEILGVAGLVGAGRTELARAVIGADPIDSGTIKMYGKNIHIKSPKDAKKQGIGYIPEDRKKDGLVLIQSVGSNAVLTVLDKISHLGVIDRKKRRDVVDESIRDLRIKCSGPDQTVKNLSGGNQQKVVVAKWLATDVKVLILDEPTRGVDVGAKSEIYDIIREFAAKGSAVMLISSEMREVLSMSDRIMVMSEGAVSHLFESNQVEQEEILEYAIPKSLEEGVMVENG